MLTRALKEIRSLLWPSVLILGTTMAAAMWTSQEAGIRPAVLALQLSILGFYVGIPLLAASSFGVEFQQRTLVLLLSQPIARGRVWLEKFAVLAVVATALVATQATLLRIGPFDPRSSLGPELLFAAAVICSTGFWTLVARSLIGGLAFSLAALFMLELAGRLLTEYFTGPVGGSGFFIESTPMAAARGSYTVLSLWLGWRLFRRLEVASGAADIKAFESAAGATWRPLRAQPHGPLLNLVRKELRLQCPTFMIAALFTGCWIAALGVLAFGRADVRVADLVFTVMLAAFLPLTVVLAGAISAGEEESIGLRAWHLTLPVPVRVQWSVKLAVTLIVAGMLVILLPAVLMMLTASVLPIEQGPVLPPYSPRAIGFLALAVLVSFWASTLLGHTVRAAVATGLTGLGLATCSALALTASREVAFLPRAGAAALMVRWQLTPDDFSIDPHALARIGPAAVGGVIALVVLWQSLAAFRQAQSSTRTLARSAAGLGAAVFVAAFCFTAAAEVASGVHRSAPVRELRMALESVIAAAPDAQSRLLTLEDLETTAKLSAPAKRWLAGAEVSVVAARSPGSRQPNLPLDYYVASVHFPNDKRYKVVFSVPQR